MRLRNLSRDRFSIQARGARVRPRGTGLSLPAATDEAGIVGAPAVGAARPVFRAAARRANAPTFAGSEGGTTALTSSPSSVCIVDRNNNCCNEERLFSRHSRTGCLAQHAGHSRRNTIAAMTVGKSAPASNPIGKIAPSKKRPSSAWPAGFGAFAITVNPPPTTAP